MKRVSCEVAIYLKEEGYPQGQTDKFYAVSDYVDIDNHYHNAKELVDEMDDDTDPLVDAPYVLDVWKWLWNEKKIFIETSVHYDPTRGHFALVFIVDGKHPYNYLSKYAESTDPEEAIEKTINYLVDHNLIK